MAWDLGIVELTEGVKGSGIVFVLSLRYAKSETPNPKTERDVDVSHGTAGHVQTQGFANTAWAEHALPDGSLPGHGECDCLVCSDLTAAVWKAWHSVLQVAGELEKSRLRSM